jgi:hypothetical protein
MDSVSRNGAAGSGLDARAEALLCLSIDYERRRRTPRSEALLWLGKSLCQTGAAPHASRSSGSASGNAQATRAPRPAGRRLVGACPAPSGLHESRIISHESPALIGTQVESKLPVTCRKQRPDLDSNRYTFATLSIPRIDPERSRRERPEGVEGSRHLSSAFFASSTSSASFAPSHFFSLELS